MNNENNNDNYDVLSLHNNKASTLTCVRPVTAISLPTKVQTEDASNTKSPNNKLVYGGAKYKNPSCPSIQNKSYSIDNDDNENEIEGRNNRNQNQKNDDYYYGQKKNSYEDWGRQNDASKRQGALNDSNISLNNNMPIRVTAATDVTNSNATINSQSSKMDTLLGFTKTILFTTKFECIGQSKSGSDTSIKNIPDSLQIRSKSVTTLNEKGSSNILSQNQINTTVNGKLPSDMRKSESIRDKYNYEINNKSLTKIKNFPIENENKFSQNNEPSYKNNHSITKSKSNNNHQNHFDNSEKNQNFISITESVFIGNIGVIKNERRMCRLNIEYLIDMTNMRPDDLNRQTLGKLPCLCKLQHSRLYLTVELVDTNYKTLFNSYAEVNKYIEKARKSNKKVLIFSKDIFQQHLIAALAQYLMLDYEMNLDNALNIISKRINSPRIYVGKSYFDYLKNFESYLQHMSINLYGTNDKNVDSEMMSKLNLKSNLKDVKNFKKFENFNDYGDDDDDDDDEDDYDDEDDDEDDDRSLKKSKKPIQNKFSSLATGASEEINNKKSAKNQSSSLKMAWI